MTDREKVLAGLKQCRNINGKCSQCPYITADAGIQICTTHLARDAYDLLMDREPIRPIIGSDHDSPDGMAWDICPICKLSVNYKSPFCWHCGRPLIWEGEEQSETETGTQKDVKT